MRGHFNAMLVWLQTPVADRTVEVNTKTGFSLTAGSYSVRASSTQYGSMTLAANADTSKTATISSVTVTRASLFYGGLNTDEATDQNDAVFSNITLTNATTVTAARATSTNSNVTVQFNVLELF